MDINCEVLLQEFNKHSLFIYYNAIESYCIFIVNNDVILNVIGVLAILFITLFSITINAAVNMLIIIIYVITIDTITFINLMIFI